MATVGDILSGLPEPEYTQQQVTDALNRACSDINDAAQLPDNGVIDALNLLVNAAVSYLTGEASDLDEVVEANYDSPQQEIKDGDYEPRTTPLDIVLGWINQ